MTTPSHHDEYAAEQFARKVTVHLGMSAEQLPYIVKERLRASRVQALLLRKRSSAPLRNVQTETDASIVGIYSDGTLALGGHTDGSDADTTPLWIRRLLTALPLIALIGALAFISAEQDNRATVEVADVDAALLTSELPPTAYTDPGFEQYLQSTVSDTP